MSTLLKKAKELGIENAETLTEPQLEKAISKVEKTNKNAEKLKEEHDSLLNRAVELGFDKELFAEFSIENLKTAISEAEAEAEANELATDKAALISELLGVDYSTATLEEIKTAAENVVIENAKSRSEVIKKHLGVELFETSPEDLDVALTGMKSIEKEIVSAEKVEEGKTTEAFELESGKKYVFAEDAPEKFRFAGVVKTQKEWLGDKDAMELMILGNLSFIKQIKK